MTAPTSQRAVPAPATAPTLHFIGVSTAGSSIVPVFPRWADALGVPDARLHGIDLPLGATADDYRAVVRFLADDPLTRGALVTTHKLDLFAACRDLFTGVDAFAELMGETSCLARRPDGLHASAKDPVTSGLAVEALLGEHHWRGRGSEVLLLGAGGASLALSWYLLRPDAGADRPARLTVTDRSPERLAHFLDLHRRTGTAADVRTVLVDPAAGGERTGRLLAASAPGTLVVNATGLGKDRPGSPLDDAAVFPERAIAWDLNYRGDLRFLDQARAQDPGRGVVAHDGWTYFLHGWTRVIADVFDLDIPTTGPVLDELSRLARDARPGNPT